MIIETYYDKSDLQDGTCTSCDEKTGIVPNDGRCPDCIEEQKFIDQTMQQDTDDDLEVHETDAELEARTDRNMDLISAFCEHAAIEGVIIPNSIVESFFDA